MKSKVHTPSLSFATTGILPYKCNGALHSSHFADSPLPPIQVTQILQIGTLKLSPAMQFCSLRSLDLGLACL